MTPKTSPFLFLVKLAWECRFRLPLLITVGMMMLDIRMHLDIQVQMRNIARHNHQRNETPPPPPPAEDNADDGPVEVEGEDNGSDSSWITIEEEEVNEDV